MKQKIVQLNEKIIKKSNYLSSFMQENIEKLLFFYEIKADRTPNKCTYTIYDISTNKKIGSAVLSKRKVPYESIKIESFFPGLNTNGDNKKNKYLSSAAIHLFIQHFAKSQMIKQDTAITIPRCSKENYASFYSKLSQYHVSIESTDKFGTFIEHNLKAVYTDLGINNFIKEIRTLNQNTDIPKNINEIMNNQHNPSASNHRPPN